MGIDKLTLRTIGYGCIYIGAVLSIATVMTLVFQRGVGYPLAGVGVWLTGVGIIEYADYRKRKAKIVAAILLKLSPPNGMPHNQ